MSKTHDNLMAAFAGESQANRKYLAFAAQAEKDGFKQAAKLFRAAAEAETVHAIAHLRNAGHVNTTPENLQAALDGETFEYTKMYPEMIADAKAEGNETVARYLGWVNQVEEIHAGLYKMLMTDPVNAPAVDYYVCPICGYTHEGPMTEACPLCKAAPSVFHKVD